MKEGEQDIGLLLPFFANGTIGETDHKRVQKALEQSADLREELAEIQTLQSMVSSGAAEWDMQHVPPDEARLSGLLVRIEVEEQTAEASGSRILQKKQPASYPVREVIQQRLGLFERLFQPVWKPAFAATLLVALTQGALLYQRDKMPAEQSGAENYQTASGPQDSVAAPDFTFLIRFRANVSWAEILNFLEKEGLIIVDGPVNGMVQVTPEGVVSEGAEQEMITTLSTNTIVESIRPIR